VVCAVRHALGARLRGVVEEHADGAPWIEGQIKERLSGQPS
jgi:hypothetical protein